MDDIREKGERGGGNPPDGTEIVSEWKEGPHRVIERRAGPGAEVSVSHAALLRPFRHCGRTWREGAWEVRRAGNADHCARPFQVEVEVQKNFYAGKLRACDLWHHPCTALEQRLRGGRGARGGEDKRTC